MARRERFPYRPDVHARLIEAAANGRTIMYGDVAPRWWVGTYLFRIAHEEDAADRPPLTSIVVRKTSGRPGPGFLQAMQEIGYARQGETEEAVWRRAVADVFTYWRGKSAADTLSGWQPKLSDDRRTWPRFQ